MTVAELINLLNELPEELKDKEVRYSRFNYRTLRPSSHPINDSFISQNYDKKTIVELSDLTDEMKEHIKKHIVE
jgi:hypothetical protein